MKNSRHAPPGEDPGADPGLTGLAWECLGVPADELEVFVGVMEVWASLLRLLPL